MLAEPRQRTKWSVDPQNVTWSRDKSRFGYQLMKKMGWSDGKGLGAQEDGQVSHIKIRKKDDTLGIGAKKSYDNVWLAHQDDFSSILSSLNTLSGGNLKSESKTEGLESTVRKSKKKIMYSKFIKSKDLSRVSETDMIGILGPKSKSAPSSPQVLSETEDNEVQIDEGSTSDSTSENHGIKTITSTFSIQDYFASKNKAKKKNEDISVDMPVEINLHKALEQKNDPKEETRKIHKKKRKKEKQREHSVNPSEETGDQQQKKKRKNEYDETEVANDAELLIGKKKRKRKSIGDNQNLSCHVDCEISSPQNEEHVPCAKKKKKKKAL